MQYLWPAEIQALKLESTSHYIIYSQELTMDFQTASLSPPPFCYYPYYPYYPVPLNSGFNSYLLPTTDRNFYDSVIFPKTPQMPLRTQFLPAKQETNHYCSKIRQNTVLKKKEFGEEEIVTRRASKEGEEPESKKRTNHAQKENRNVVSNLLRIFFKNILEVDAYDQVIDAIIRKHKIVRGVEDFITWLQKFKINYKNYIRPAQIQKIMTAKHSKDFQKIFIILLQHYMDDIGLSHCLTSKRIDRTCIKRHLEGLRALTQLTGLSKN